MPPPPCPPGSKGPECTKKKQIVKTPALCNKKLWILRNKKWPIGTGATESQKSWKEPLWLAYSPKGGFFSESAIRFSNLQKKNIPKNYPELERSIFQTFWKLHCCAKFLFIELETSNFGYLLIF